MFELAFRLSTQYNRAAPLYGQKLPMETTMWINLLLFVANVGWSVGLHRCGLANTASCCHNSRRSYVCFPTIICRYYH